MCHATFFISIWRYFLVFGTAWHFFNNALCLVCMRSHTQHSILIRLCHFPPGIWQRTCLWSHCLTLYTHTHTHTHRTHTAVIMCVFFCLFNLDGMFHLQAAITAGCLIVWVRLMGICAGVCVSSTICIFSLCSNINLCVHYIATTVCLPVQERTHFTYI